MSANRLVLGAALFALVLTLATVPKARKLGSPDFKVFYTAARHVWENPADMYRVSPDRYLYPPSTAPLLSPFAFTKNYEWHQWSWHAFLGVLLFSLSRVSWAALAAMVLLTRYLAVTFGYGQINLPVLALMAGAGKALGTRREALSGALFAVATSLKVYPVVLFPAFLRRFSWQAFWGMGMAAAFLLLLPLLLFGDLGITLYREFFAALEAKGLPLHSHNQSLSAFFLRLFTDQPFYLHAVGETKWAWLSLDPALVKLATFGVGMVLTGISWFRAWRKNQVESFLSAASFSLLFLSHIVWKDYLLFLYFPLRELFASLSRRGSWALASAVFALVTFSSHDVVGAPLSTRLDASCIHLMAAVLVWVSWIRK